MRRHRLFAAGLSAALLFGVASPALAKPKEKPVKEKPAKDPKPAKTKGGVNGGGVTANGASFSIQVHAASPGKGHFNYTSADGTWKVRCHNGFTSYSPHEYFAAGPAGASVTADCTEIKAHKNTRQAVTLEASFVDNGKTADMANIKLTRGSESLTDDGPIREGSIHVR
jgi:hypothetical protein